MFRARAGQLGSRPTIPRPIFSSASDQSAAIAAAITAVSNDPAAASLSPPARANLTSLETALSIAIGQDVIGASVDQITSVVTDVATDIALNASLEVAQTISVAVDLIPIAGQIINFVVGIIDLIGSSDAQVESYCRSYLTYWTIGPGGARRIGTAPADVGGPHGIAPSDWFTPNFPCDDVEPLGGAQQTALENACDMGQLSDGACDQSLWNGRKCPGGMARPAFGQALMTVTEGSPFDRREFPTSSPTYITWDADVQAHLSTLAAMSGGKGISKERRLLYERVRRGIEASAHVDGGISLWPIYVDMLYQDVLRGSQPLAPSYVRSALEHCRFGAAWFGPLGSTCPDQLKFQIQDMLLLWGNTVDPQTKLGEQKLAQIEAEAEERTRQLQEQQRIRELIVPALGVATIAAVGYGIYNPGAVTSAYNAVAKTAASTYRAVTGWLS